MTISLPSVLSDIGVFVTLSVVEWAREREAIQVTELVPWSELSGSSLQENLTVKTFK